MEIQFWSLATLSLLFVKHWYVDFVIQTTDEVNSKGQYGSWLGIQHSFKHALGTLLVFGFMGESLGGAMILAVLDFITHYHIDWAKMNWGARDIQTPEFWQHLGLDQMAHSLNYLLLVYLVIINLT